MQGLEALVGVVVGVVAVGVLAYFLIRAKQSEVERLSAELQKALNEAQAERQRAAELATNEATLKERSGRLPDLERQLLETQSIVSEHRAEIEKLRIDFKDIETQRKMILEEKDRLEVTLTQAEERLRDSFNALASKALSKNNEDFLTLARESFKKLQEGSSGDLEKRQQAIDAMLKPVAEKLKEYDEGMKKLGDTTITGHTKLEEQVKALMDGLQIQSKTASELKTILKGSSTRGTLGELFLKRVLDAAGLTQGLHYEMQVTHANTDDDSTGRPDCVVHLPSGRDLVIDAKTPMSAYENAVASDDDQERHTLLKAHASNVRKHVDGLAKRRYEKIVPNADMVVMYMPIEAAYTAAMEADPALIAYGWDKKVLISSPTLLYALVQVVALDWRQSQIRENAEKIAKLGAELVERTAKVADEFGKLGSALATANNAFGKAQASFNSRLVVTARKFQDLGVAPAKGRLPEVDEANPLDSGVAALPGRAEDVQDALFTTEGDAPD